MTKRDQALATDESRLMRFKVPSDRAHPFGKASLAHGLRLSHFQDDIRAYGMSYSEL